MKSANGHYGEENEKLLNENIATVKLDKIMVSWNVLVLCVE